MKSLFLLLVLTQNGAGDINVSFVNTETLEQCQKKALMLDGVFTGSRIPVLENRCVQSAMRFSEFGHAAAASKIRHYYLVRINEAGVDVENVPDWSGCMAQAKQSVAEGRIYCGSSVQKRVQ